MQSKRQLQVAEQVKRHFSQVLQMEGFYIYGDQALVTVTSAAVAPDLSMAKIYLSIYNVDDKQEVIIQMRESVHRLQQGLAQRLKKHLRRVPRLEFFEDETLDEIYRINNMFDRLKVDREEE